MNADGMNQRLFDPSHYTLNDFVSSDQAMKQCLHLAGIAAQTDLPILILGESGTGKTLLARAIHNSSKRATGTFISFNAAALSDTLLDSQLFGHEKGAFTGADKIVKGKFELANAGTLFIDEIADMSLAAQAKILRAIEYGEFERLGSAQIRVANVRVISATHISLSGFQRSGAFRKDLFYRLSGITISIPPLRERPDDLPSLIAAEVMAASKEQGKSITGLEKDAADLLFSYGWPGNLRELSRIIRVAVALTSGNTIPPDALLLSNHESANAENNAGNLSLKECERAHIQKVLNQVSGNKRKAARILGISRSTLDRKLLS